MPGPIPKRVIVDSCLSGMSEAARFYDDLSGGLALWEAPEWLLQTEIARALGKHCHYVTLESSVSWLLEAAEARKSKKEIRNKTGRIDITVWSGGDYPRFLIEVKKAWDSNSLNEDAKRLRKMMKRGGSLHRGLMVAYATAAKEETIRRRFQETASNSKSRLVKSLKPSKIDASEEKSWLWSAAVFEA